MFVTTRKILTILLCLTLIGCSAKDSSIESTELNTSDKNSESNLLEKEEEVSTIEPLLIWSFTDDFLKEVKGFEVQYNAKVTLEVMDINGFVPMVAGVIKGGLEMPDVIVVEENQLKNKQLEPLLYDLTSLIEGHETDLYSYSIQKGIIGMADPILAGLSYSVSPLGIYYRRSMAIKALGTDDPQVVSEYFNSVDKLSEMSTRLNGFNIKLFSDLFTLRYFSNLSGNWFDGEGNLMIKESVRNYLEFLKQVQVEKQVAFANEWSDKWFEGMYKPINNGFGEDMSIFAYVLPNWGLSNILMLTGSSEEFLYQSEDEMIRIYNETKGDWGIAIPRYPNSLGGSYLTVNKTSEHIELAKSFVKYMILDKEHAQRFLNNTDMTSSLKSVATEQVFEKGTEFVGGQDFHKTFATIADNLDSEFIRLSAEYTVEPTILEEEATTNIDTEATTNIDTEATADIDTEATTGIDTEATADVKDAYAAITVTNNDIQIIFDAIVIDFMEGKFHTTDEAIETFKKDIFAVYPGLDVQSIDK